MELDEKLLEDFALEELNELDDAGTPLPFTQRTEKFAS